jgi:AcrR family transcriptional regulator
VVARQPVAGENNGRVTESGGARRRGRPSTGVREAILQAASEILAERGVAGLATREIAQRAQVAESSIFYHFKDRLGLLQAIVSASVPAFADVVATAGADLEQSSLQEGLARLLDALEALYARVIPVQAAVLSDPDLKDTFTRRTAQLDIGPHRALPRIVAYLETEQRAGRLRADADPRTLALMIVGAAHQRALFRHLGIAPDRLPSSHAIATNLALTMSSPGGTAAPGGQCR